MDYRVKENYKVITFPKGFEEEDRGVKGCCTCKELVLAHPSDSETFKNDCTGVYLKRSDPGDLVAITMEDANGATITNLGTAAIFPNDSDTVGFIYDWQQILNANGIGCYTIKVNFTIAGVTSGYTHGIYELRQFSTESSKGTVRIKSAFNTFYQKLLVDFTDSNFVDCVRFNGYFGDRQPKTEINNIVSKNRRVEKSTRENVNNYFLKTDPLDICITRQLVDFHFLNEDDCFVSDYNYHNHDYLIQDKSVELIDSSELEYFRGNRLAKLEATFGDRNLLDKNFYKTS